jgi:PhnB protein
MKKKPASKKRPAARRAAPPKKKAVKPIPDGYHVVTPYLALNDAARAIDFYKRAFGARERLRMDAPGGKVGHAELVIGDSAIMLADEFAEMEFLGPQSRGGTTVSLHLYVKDCDAAFAKAVAAGATVMRPLRDEFYGDRTGTLRDPFGHMWHLATHKEDLTPAEMRRRGEAAMKEMK